MNAYRFAEGYPISQCVALCRRDFGENAKTPCNKDLLQGIFAV
jgi:hypothetical protein